MKSLPTSLKALTAALLLCSASLPAAEVTVSAPDSPMLRYALGKLEAALQRQGHTMKQATTPTATQGASITVTVDPAALADLGVDGFQRVNSGPRLKITGGAERGAMYGVLDAAEQIRQGKPWQKIEPGSVKKPFEFRALKFNLPYAAYRTSPVIEQHYDTCKDPKFWEAFLDMMVENRFNALTLWSHHPFHYMVRPTNFPEATPFSDAELEVFR
jgi:hypothetical protein